MMFRSIYKSFLTIFLLCVGCEYKYGIEERTLPLILTEAPKVYTDCVRMKAEIVYLGNEKIKAYGFVWSDNSKDPSADDYVLIKHANIGEEQYSMTVSSAWIEGNTYRIRAYCKSDKNDYYGNPITFQSKGSLPVEITDFEPKKGYCNTSVKISGRNFAFATYENIVKFGDIEAVVDSVVTDTLYIRVPFMNEIGSLPIHIQVSDKSFSSNEEFNVEDPWELIGSYDYQYYSGTCFSIGNKIYAVPPNSHVIQIYDGNANMEVYMDSLPEYSYVKPRSTASEEFGFILLDSNIYKYDPVSSDFILHSKSPIKSEDNAYLFYLDNRLFIGKRIGEEKYVYESNSWKPRSNENMPFSESFNYSSYNDFGYISQAYYWERQGDINYYNPVSDEWQFLTHFPYECKEHSVMFIHDDKIFLGFGKNKDSESSFFSKEFWYFNLNSKKWSQLSNLESNLYFDLSCVIKEEAYFFCRKEVENEIDLQIWKIDLD